MRWFGWFRRRKVVPPETPPKEKERFRVRYGVEDRVQVIASDSGTEARKLIELLSRRRDVAWLEFWDGDVCRSRR